MHELPIPLVALARLYERTQYACANMCVEERSFAKPVPLQPGKRLLVRDTPPLCMRGSFREGKLCYFRISSLILTWHTFCAKVFVTLWCFVEAFNRCNSRYVAFGNANGWYARTNVLVQCSTTLNCRKNLLRILGETYFRIKFTFRLFGNNTRLFGN